MPRRDPPATLTPTALAERLERRLAELRREQAAIEDALVKLGGAPVQSPATVGGVTDLRDRLFAALRENSGARASMLALSLGQSVEVVRAELEALRVSGVVESWRLGFRLTDPVGLHS